MFSPVSAKEVRSESILRRPLDESSVLCSISPSQEHLTASPFYSPSHESMDEYFVSPRLNQSRQVKQIPQEQKKKPSKGKRSNGKFSEAQTKILMNHFTLNPRPDAGTIESLSILVSLSVQQVKIWFQNRRARTKKRKMKGKSKGFSSSRLSSSSNLRGTKYQSKSYKMRSSSSYLLGDVPEDEEEAGSMVGIHNVNFDGVCHSRVSSSAPIGHNYTKDNIFDAHHVQKKRKEQLPGRVSSSSSSSSSFPPSYSSSFPPLLSINAPSHLGLSSRSSMLSAFVSSTTTCSSSSSSIYSTSACSQHQDISPSRAASVCSLVSSESSNDTILDENDCGCNSSPSSPSPSSSSLGSGAFSCFYSLKELCECAKSEFDCIMKKEEEEEEESEEKE
ncbi:hypothetical protein ADUPG1_011289 [Aduncisulcus paluster]|uniref:Homeobox domain-containing protein n=1 Tax=Aduncisulcus paluster TaxID=2918883 RepID=A0ABQ5JZE4_9EUKA|nr:hypothetical protein ADUPG1_011289 [Aduncisulcus paluster]